MVGTAKAGNLREPINGFREAPGLQETTLGNLQLRGYFLAPFSQPMVVQSGTLERLWNRDGP
ncbi:hypothetical protein StoSoilB20_40600 [Arthrobacter sp. StoSoilB20]|nr:hypothetical protein StoSoilB20_40600 [Arthrobacter sp. StoSoilB20]